MLSSIDPTNTFDRPDGLFPEIYRIDGNDYRNLWFFDSDHFGPNGDDANLRIPIFTGVAQTIDFRLRTTDNCFVWALAIVLPEED